MSQYRRSPVGGAGRIGDYRQRLYPEENGGYQYEDYEYGAEEVQMRDIDRRQQHHLAPQPRRPPPRSPMSSRQEGSGYPGLQQSSQSPRVPPNGPFGSQDSRGYRGGSGYRENYGYQEQQRPPPPLAARRNFTPPSVDPYYAQERESNMGFSYDSNRQQIRPTPRLPRFQEGNPTPVSDPRSYIGFNPTFPQRATSPEAPSVPAVPPSVHLARNQQKKPASGVPQPARRGTSSYYLPQTQGVPPIPEESYSDRRPSYASSSAIPTAWDPESMERYPGVPDGYSTDGDGEEFRLPAEVGAPEDEKGLVRQASIGRKSKPTITDIKGIDRIKSPNPLPRNKSSNESINTTSTGGVPVSVAGIGLSRLAEKKSSSALEMPVLDPPTPLSGIPSIPESAGPSPLSQPPLTIKKSEYQFSLPGWPGQAAGASAEPAGREEASVTGKPIGQTVKSTRRPPKLNMDAVRDAEARGSLTSLPDLIRRATKLAAVLETERPDSRWGMRDSYMGGPPGRTNSDSISDMLASFPPPVLASNKQGKRGTTMSRWPLPADFGNGDESAASPSPKAIRRICGLPLWAFVLLVIVGLLVVSAAVIVPLQLVKLSKESKDDGKSSQSLLAECRAKNLCKNGGESVVTGSLCGCVCTSGFTGPDCTQKQDSSCTTVNLQDLQEGRIENVTMGSALPRLFDKAKPSYNITLDTPLIMAVFSNQNISCTAQNAMVEFGGKSSPSGNIKRFARDSSTPLDKRQLTTDPSLPSPAVSGTPTATRTSGSSATGVPEPDAIDFGRVVVLYLADVQNFKYVADAQQKLQKAFSSGITSGNLSIGNDISINFTNHTIKLADGTVVGGASGNSTDISNNGDTTSKLTKRSLLEGLTILFA